MLSLPPGTEMFQFPGFPVPTLCIQVGLTGHDPSRVSPFGDPWIDGWLTPPQGLSQSPTSFIGSRCQGIHRVLFSTCRRDARARYGVLKDRRHEQDAGLPLVMKGGSGWSSRGRRRNAPSELHKVPTHVTGSCGPVISRCHPHANMKMTGNPRAEVHGPTL